MAAFVEVPVSSIQLLQCVVGGEPAPTLRWLKDGLDITDHPRFHFDHSPEGVVSMIIEQVTPDDGGCYECVAENSEGSATTTTFLRVLECGTSQPGPLVCAHVMGSDGGTGELGETRVESDSKLNLKRAGGTRKFENDAAQSFEFDGQSVDVFETHFDCEDFGDVIHEQGLSTPRLNRVQEGDKAEKGPEISGDAEEMLEVSIPEFSNTDKQILGKNDLHDVCESPTVEMPVDVEVLDSETDDLMQEEDRVGDLLRECQTDDLLVGCLTDDLLQDGLEDDLLKADLVDDLLQFGQTDDVLKGGQANTLLMGGLADDLFQDGQTDDLLQDGQTDALLHDGEKDGLQQDGQRDGLLQIGLIDNLLQNVQVDDLFQDSQTGDHFLQDGLVQNTLRHREEEKQMEDGQIDTFLQNGQLADLLQDGQIYNVGQDCQYGETLLSPSYQDSSQEGQSLCLKESQDGQSKERPFLKELSEESESPSVTDVSFPRDPNKADKQQEDVLVNKLVSGSLSSVDTSDIFLDDENLYYNSTETAIRAITLTEEKEPTIHSNDELTTGVAEQVYADIDSLTVDPTYFCSNPCPDSSDASSQSNLRSEYCVGESSNTQSVIKGSTEWFSIEGQLAHNEITHSKSQSEQQVSDICFSNEDRKDKDKSDEEDGLQLLKGDQSFPFTDIASDHEKQCIDGARPESPFAYNDSGYFDSSLLLNDSTTQSSHVMTPAEQAIQNGQVVDFLQDGLVDDHSLQCGQAVNTLKYSEEKRQLQYGQAVNTTRYSEEKKQLQDDQIDNAIQDCQAEEKQAFTELAEDLTEDHDNTTDVAVNLSGLERKRDASVTERKELYLTLRPHQSSSDTQPKGSASSQSGNHNVQRICYPQAASNEESLISQSLEAPHQQELSRLESVYNGGEGQISDYYESGGAFCVIPEYETPSLHSLSDSNLTEVHSQQPTFAKDPATYPRSEHYSLASTLPTTPDHVDDVATKPESEAAKEFSVTSLDSHVNNLSQNTQHRIHTCTASTNQEALTLDSHCASCITDSETSTLNDQDDTFSTSEQTSSQEQYSDTNISSRPLGIVLDGDRDARLYLACGETSREIDTASSDNEQVDDNDISGLHTAVGMSDIIIPYVDLRDENDLTGHENLGESILPFNLFMTSQISRDLWNRDQTTRSSEAHYIADSVVQGLVPALGLSNGDDSTEVPLRLTDLVYTVPEGDANSLRLTATLTIPEFIRSPEAVSVQAGQTIIVTCEVKGYPDPEVTWVKIKDTKHGADQDLRTSHRVRVHQEGQVHHLEIWSAGTSDSGQYACTASNTEGSISATVSVIVHEASKPLSDMGATHAELQVDGGSECIRNGNGVHEVPASCPTSAITTRTLDVHFNTNNRNGECSVDRISNDESGNEESWVAETGGGGRVGDDHTIESNRESVQLQAEVCTSSDSRAVRYAKLVGAAAAFALFAMGAHKVIESIRK